ncbi:MAG TPA: calcium-binding protein [Thiothrix sp.]|nr:calcium-binding protein [Thiothrix sp.]
MISNNAIQSHATSNTHTPANKASPLNNIQHSFSQSQFSSSQSNTLPSSLSLQDLLQLIQNLINQLSGNTVQEPSEKSGTSVMQNNPMPVTKESDTSSPAQPANKPTPPEPKKGLTDTGGINGNPPITGTVGDDELKGTRAIDGIFGREGNDRLLGRQGNDFLAGEQGNDRLYGGKGDDTLEGGEGNDYLSGGRGNNTLSGGAGNDTLYSRLGSDKLDGGTGMDTARIRANIDDYTITANDNNVLLTHKKTGQTIEATNIEKFRFDDARLSLAEMQQRADADRGVDAEPTVVKPINNDTLLPLSAAQRESLLDVFGVSGATGDAGLRVVDEDNSGNISTGDTAILATGDASSVSQQFKTLSAEDVAAINGTNTEVLSPQQVNLTAAQQQAVEGVTGLRDVHVDDVDGSGTLSVGDVAVSSIAGSQKKELSAADVAAVFDFQPPSVTLTPAQQTAFEALTGFSDLRVDDNDLSNTLSVGDDVVNTANGDKVTLTAENLSTSSSSS